MIIGIENYKSINGIAQAELDLASAFLQGAVYCWCKNNKNHWFAARDLVGGDNYFWQYTPLMPLYEHYLNMGSQEYAVDQAGKAAGRLLKKILIEDKRTFQTRENFSREYLWTGEEDNG